MFTMRFFYELILEFNCIFHKRNLLVENIHANVFILLIFFVFQIQPNGIFRKIRTNYQQTQKILFQKNKTVSHTIRIIN